MDSQIAVGSFGSYAVGKTCITVQFVRNEFCKDHDPTLEDVYERKMMIEGDAVPTHLTIYDTAGQEQYQMMNAQYMRNAEGILLVYSVIDEKSFTAIKTLHEQILMAKEVSSSANTVPIVLVGNKVDLREQRKITTEQGQQLANELSVPFLETSAKSRFNIDEAFQALVKEIRRIQELKKNSAAGAGSGSSSSSGSNKGSGGHAGKDGKGKDKCIIA